MATEIKQKFHEVRLSMVTSDYDQVDTDSQIDLESLSAEQNTNKFSKLSPPSDLCWFHYPSQPWSVSYYFNEGQENFHIYLWLLKDLAWVQSWYLPGIFIGGFACFWSIFLVSKSIYHRNVNEFWSRFADLLWLFANYWWMLGETHDYEKPNEPSQYEAKTRQAAAIMITALVWIGSYYLVLKPFGVVDKFTNTPTPPAPVTDSLVEEHPRPRFAFYFNSWREYENLHSLFWIGKDTAWVLAKTPMWFLFFFPTLSVSIDVTVTTLFKPNLLIDHAHHCAQLLWVLANAVWATGELFLTTHHDEPLSLARFDSEARVTARWWSSWVVLFSFLPLLLLHLIWIPATFTRHHVTAQSLQENNLQFPRSDGTKVEENMAKSSDSSQQEQPLQNENHCPAADHGSSVSSNGSPDSLPMTFSVFSPLFIDRDPTSDQSSHSINL